MTLVSLRLIDAPYVRTLCRLGVLAAVIAMAACGGRADPSQPSGAAPTATAPIITTDPADQTVTAGQTATFTVVAGGSAPLNFQWQRNGVAIAQATGASYTTPATITSDSGAAFSVVVANSLGTVSSRSATLTVNATAAVVVTFSQRPADTTVAAGAAATFSAAATCSDGSTALYQWDRTDDAGATYTHISQATSATYSFTTSSADNGAKFRVLVTCGATTTSSLLVTLTVTAAAATGPTAAFTAPGTANALAPVALDASASTSADGSALQYVWDFGNGARGGGVKIAHVFAATGDNTVKLTVIDGASLKATTSKTITIAAPTTASTVVTTQILVKGVDGTPLPGVTVSPASAATAASDASGKLTASVNAGAPTSLKFSKSGYADQFLNFTVPAGAGTDGYVQITMSARDAALTLADAAAGGALTGRDGASITLPANAFIDASGAPVTGAVQISITPVDVTQAGAGGFPGGFEGIQTDGTQTSIVSAGVNEFVPTVNGAPIQLAPGKSATITIPIYASLKLDGTLLVVGDTIPLWSLDEATGLWIQEGTGTVVASTDSPSGLAMSAVVTHLSWWNSDLGFDPYGPTPKCEAQGGVGIPGSTDAFAAASICNMLAEIDRNLGGAGSGSAVNTGAQVHASSRLHAQKTVPTAATVSPRTLAFSRQYVVPVSGGKIIPVPANTDIRLTAFALNGSWTGSTVVHGASRVVEDVVVTLHPINQVSGTAEAIALPFDDTRSVAAASTALFTFSTSAAAVARVTISPSNSSVFAGQLRVLRGTTVLGSATVVAGSTQQVVAYLPAAGTYTIAADIDRVAAFRLQAALEPGDAQVQPITFPFDAVRVLLPQATATFSSSVTGSPYARIVVSPDSVSGGSALTGQVRVLQGSTVLGSATLGGSSTQLLVGLPANGAYTIEISGTAGTSFHLTANLEGTVQSDTLTIPTDITRNLAAEDVYRGTLNLAAATTLWFDSQGNGNQTDVKFSAADGIVLFDSPPGHTNSEALNSFVATLPAGSYTVQVAPKDAAAAIERLTLATTPWAPVAPTLPVQHSFQLADLVLDHNGKPVVGLIASSVVNQRNSYTLQLRRWAGTAWETVGSDLVIGGACAATGAVSFAFDSANNPVVLSASVSPTDSSVSFSAHRFSGGAWAALGANDGQLPYGSGNSSVCEHPTTTLIGADDQPVVVYATNIGAVMVHFDGTSWAGYVTPGGDVFGNFNTYFDARFDPAGKLWLITGASDFYTAGKAQRLNTTTHAWETVGGALPLTSNLVGLQQPRLRFDSAGSPVVAWLAWVGSNGTASAGVAVYRFDGTNWSTTGGYQPDSNSYGGAAPDPAFVLFNDQALVAWDSTQRDQGFSTVVVQTNTASGWTPLSGTLGQIPQYSDGAMNPDGAMYASRANGARMVTDGTEVYLAVTAISGDVTGSLTDTAVTLLKKVAN